MVHQDSQPELVVVEPVTLAASKTSAHHGSQLNLDITEDQIAVPRDAHRAKMISKQESKKTILEPLASITQNSKASVDQRNNSTDMKCYIAGLHSSRESYPKHSH